MVISSDLWKLQIFKTLLVPIVLLCAIVTSRVKTNIGPRWTESSEVGADKTKGPYSPKQALCYFIVHSRNNGSAIVLELVIASDLN